MGKSIQKVMTRGVQELGLSSTVMDSLFRKAGDLLPKATFLSFVPEGNQVKIDDGDGRTLGSLPVTLPTKLWIISDDYVDRYVATALLPSEY